MPYLVDGHNLIPHLPGLSLADLEDERALIDLLARFANLKRTRVEVFFDQAPPTWSGSQSFGRLKVHFVRRGKTADQAIISHLKQLGKRARNWTTVTSDREILAEARAYQSKIEASPAFAITIREALTGSQGGSSKGEDPRVSDEEVDYWLNIFEEDAGAGS